MSVVTNQVPAQLPLQVARTTASLATLYSMALAGLERSLPIKPSWVSIEVIGGVLLVGLPVMYKARHAHEAGIKLTWQDYERMVMAGFIGAGIPICIWQALEYAAVPNLS
ncbi:hypothetical protein [Candidatus Viridilinea mediisalina]|uniref:Uncharacterized protein n=1 Tax=Candidatus Viridilinea mediisalina TaxID=2024553 RepID=A0A2A6RFB5_9CHLR|nr:hypothetical protein [Candidatus Viridilinea mediisalina]PDW01576.1 hypothetical protein CJ255_18390 [Candidatus Viridilinea mediisalina]